MVMLPILFNNPHHLGMALLQDQPKVIIILITSILIIVISMPRPQDPIVVAMSWKTSKMAKFPILFKVRFFQESNFLLQLLPHLNFPAKK